MFRSPRFLKPPQLLDSAPGGAPRQCPTIPLHSALAPLVGHFASLHRILSGPTPCASAVFDLAFSRDPFPPRIVGHPFRHVQKLARPRPAKRLEARRLTLSVFPSLRTPRSSNKKTRRRSSTLQRRALQKPVLASRPLQALLDTVHIYTTRDPACQALLWLSCLLSCRLSLARLSFSLVRRMTQQEVKRAPFEEVEMCVVGQLLFPLAIGIDDE